MTKRFDHWRRFSRVVSLIGPTHTLGWQKPCVVSSRALWPPPPRPTSLARSLACSFDRQTKPPPLVRLSATQRSTQSLPSGTCKLAARPSYCLASSRSRVRNPLCSSLRRRGRRPRRGWPSGRVHSAGPAAPRLAFTQTGAQLTRVRLPASCTSRPDNNNNAARPDYDLAKSHSQQVTSARRRLASAAVDHQDAPRGMPIGPRRSHLGLGSTPPPPSPPHFLSAFAKSASLAAAPSHALARADFQRSR